MKFTLSWLKDHLETSASTAEIVDTLTRIGLEVEHVDNPAEKLKDFVVAYVIEAKQHPNADRLRVCQVEVGAAAPLTIVCGAPNAAAGMKVPCALVGARLPGIEIKPVTMRGVESRGMLCSARELGLSEDHSGLLPLADDLVPGTDVRQALGLESPEALPAMVREFAQPGDYVVFRAEMDAIVVFSACPQDMLPINNGVTVEAHFEVLDQ